MSSSNGPGDSLACIFSLSGPSLTDDESAFFAEARPFGFILFARNCETPEQVRALTESLRTCVGWDCPVLIDQEGGRVQRLKPPNWRQYPAAQNFGDVAADDLEAALESLRFNTLQMAEDLRDVGVDVTCSPVLDVLSDITHEVIGDRAFSRDPKIVSRLGLSVCRHYLQAGITPVIKHIPGHGRAASDSHKDLPIVDTLLEEMEETDFLPFREIAASDCAEGVWGMMAHVIYSALDTKKPASISAKIITDIVRGSIGFDGFLMGDDLDMAALEGYGDVAARAVHTIEAGCDAALYCAGELPKMEKIAESVPKLSENAQKRLQKSADFRKLIPLQKVSS